MLLSECAIGTNWKFYDWDLVILLYKNGKCFWQENFVLRVFVMLLLDLAFDVIKLKETVMKVETTFVGAGVDVVVNNAACVHPVSKTFFPCAHPAYIQQLSNRVAC